MALDEVTFGTNWVAEAEHGGFYQAVVDGTYEKYGLKVTIIPEGRAGDAARRQDPVLHAGQPARHVLGGRAGRAGDGGRGDLPEGAADHHGSSGERAEGVRRPCQAEIALHGRRPLRHRLPVDEGGIPGHQGRAAQALQLHRRAVPRRQGLRPAGLRHLRAVRGREGGRLQADRLPDRRRRLHDLRPR